jgi:hypothetical protein
LAIGTNTSDKIRDECCHYHASNEYAEVPAERIVNCPDIFVVFVEIIDHGIILSAARAMCLDRKVIAERLGSPMVSFRGVDLPKQFP